MRACELARRYVDDARRPPNRVRQRLQVLRGSSRREQGEFLRRSGDYQPGRPQRFWQNHADELADRPDQTIPWRDLRPRPYAATTRRVFPTGRILHAVRLFPSRHERLRFYLLAAAAPRFRARPSHEAYRRGPRARWYGAGGPTQSGGLQQRDAS